MTDKTPYADAYSAEPADLVFILEGLVDKRGLKTVLEALETVCNDKAEHLRANWQDKHSALCWDRAATACGKAATTGGVKNVS